MKNSSFITTLFSPQNTIETKKTNPFEKGDIITTVQTAVDTTLNYLSDCSIFQLDGFSYLPKNEMSVVKLLDNIHSSVLIK